MSPHSENPNRSRERRRGFSLVEVVLAIGVFAGAIVVIAGLLPSLIGAGRESADLAAADGACRAVTAHLSEMGFSAVAPALLIDADVAESTDASDPRLFFVNRAADRVGTAAQAAAWTASSVVERGYFEAMLIRNAELSPPAGDDARGVVVFSLQLTWPACRADGSPVPRAHRTRYAVNATLRR